MNEMQIPRYCLKILIWKMIKIKFPSLQIIWRSRNKKLNANFITKSLRIKFKSCESHNAPNHCLSTINLWENLFTILHHWEIHIYFLRILKTCYSKGTAITKKQSTVFILEEGVMDLKGCFEKELWKGIMDQNTFESINTLEVIIIGFIDRNGKLLEIGNVHIIIIRK